MSESLRKEAKRRLRALREHDPDATLRDVQHAMARERGFAGWTALIESAALAKYERIVDVLLDAYRTGTPDAMEQIHRVTWHRRSWRAMRTYVQLDLGKRPNDPGGEVELTRDDARYLVARDFGYATWHDLVAGVTAEGARAIAKPVLAMRDWDDVLDALRASPAVRVHAQGEMTDAILAEVAAIDGITWLDLSGSRALTDAGVRHLARIPTLRHLDLGGTAVTDAALDALGTLPQLETLSLAWTRVTDDGLAHLARNRTLAELNLMGTHTGDGAIRAMAGNAALRHLHSGDGVTDAGLAALHGIPAYATWLGGEEAMSLLGYRASPNQLALHGPFTDAGMRQLRGLDGLYALNLDDASLGITARGLEPLASLPRLAWLGVDAKDDMMPVIASLPALRFLGAQDTPASDDGFVALSASRTLEYLWGRRCHGLGARGFRALGTMPALRGLSVSCRNVPDDALAALPEFPALRELMPMDVPDAGYRHIGRCAELTSLILMYCRETTDAATEHITGLSNLSYYFNSYTTITDRTPELLSTMDSLERITFDTCHGLTDAGVAALARLPRLRELRVSGRGVTPNASAAFRRSVRVHVGD